MSPERRRLANALLLSLLIHSLLLSLTFGGDGTGFPGFGFPWQERRIEVPDLRLVIVPAPVTSEETAVAPIANPSLQASIEQRAVDGPAATPSVPAASTPGRTAGAIRPAASPAAETRRPVRPLRHRRYAPIGPVRRRLRRFPRRP